MGLNHSHDTSLGSRDVYHLYAKRSTVILYNIRYNPLRQNFLPDQDLLFGKCRIWWRTLYICQFEQIPRKAR